MKINFNLRNLKPNKIVIEEAVATSLVATGIWFIVGFFGLMAFFNWIPKGFEVLVLVFASVYIKHILEVKI